MAAPNPTTAPPERESSARRVVAGVSLSGPDLRYAEVVHEGGAARLRRLGVLDFAFDVERAVLGDGAPDALSEVAEALGEVLGGTEASVLVVAAHPTTTTTFFTPLPAGISDEARDSQLRQETALLADLAPDLAVRVRAVPVRSESGPGGGRRWYHVVHAAEPVHIRLSLLADALGVPAYDLADTTRAVAALADRPANGAAGGAEAPVEVVVGAYAAHTEVALCQGGAFLFGHSGAGTTPEDTAYFALSALQHAGLDAAAASRLRTYGTAADADRLALAADLLGRDLEPLDPFAPFGRSPDVSAAERAAFAPVLGGSL
ncbi:hypothetical protein RQM47_05980 [Rubrivirga sp. S365]|uniref:hypothetical protein n=1 Tax=Rubrivirga sp. S365 TaxID=3076080 RepID=UPI0028CAFCFC|nr:hypothetical protein [Rubrivirga sp. S365]MDT7856181.1 hypothetical protein [Rubrivirga sp. S365]